METERGVPPMQRGANEQDDTAREYVPFCSPPVSGPFSGPNGSQEAMALLAQLAYEKHEKTLKRNPNDQAAILGIAGLLSQDMHHPKALAWMDEKGSLMRANKKFQALYACQLLMLGEYAECVRFLDDHPEVTKEDPLVGAMRIRAMLYDPAVGARQIYEATGEWSRLFCAHAPIQRSDKVKQAADRIRVGFVSTRFNHHNMAIPVHNLLKHTPRDAFEIVLFSDTKTTDEYSRRIRRLANEWHDITKLSCADAAKIIDKQNIHILVDIMEYSNESRLSIFGYKPAPIQLHWLGNAVTTGLSAMDYRLSSAVADPAEYEQWSAEQVIRIPNYYLYSPSLDTARTMPSRCTPAAKSGYITFGAIHHLAKYNEEVLDAWRIILDRVADSRLLLGRRDFLSESTREAFIQRLCSHGIPKERVELVRSVNCGANDQHPVVTDNEIAFAAVGAHYIVIRSAQINEVIPWICPLLFPFIMNKKPWKCYASDSMIRFLKFSVRTRLCWWMMAAPTKRGR